MAVEWTITIATHIKTKIFKLRKTGLLEKSESPFLCVYLAKSPLSIRIPLFGVYFRLIAHIEPFSFMLVSLFQHLRVNILLQIL